MQVSAHLAALLDARNKHHVIPVVGGMSEQKQRRLLAREPAIVVATPGRLWELINARVPHISDLTALRFLVIDEADRILDLGAARSMWFWDENDKYLLVSYKFDFLVL